MTDDRELLRRYAVDRDEAAFTELVRRHLDLVFSAARRQVGGDLHAAEDVTQAVFADLARKAGRVARHENVAAWLYTSTRYAAAKARRGDQRRRQREQQAAVMNEYATPPVSNPPLEELGAVLDEAMHDLKPADRAAILLRYFQGCDLASVGAALGVREGAAQMRVSRALEKLRRSLARRGVTLSTAALAAALSGQAVISAPAGLATGVAGAVLAEATAAGVGLASTVLNLMNTTTLKVCVAGAAVVASLGTPLALQHRANTRLRAENLALQQQADTLTQLRAENQRLASINLDAEELTRLRQEHLELLRLRSEVGRLRQQVKDSGPPRAALPDPATAPPGTLIPLPDLSTEPLRGPLLSAWFPPASPTRC